MFSAASCIYVVRSLSVASGTEQIQREMRKRIPLRKVWAVAGVVRCFLLAQTLLPIAALLLPSGINRCHGIEPRIAHVTKRCLQTTSLSREVHRRKDVRCGSPLEILYEYSHGRGIQVKHRRRLLVALAFVLLGTTVNPVSAAAKALVASTAHSHGALPSVIGKWEILRAGVLLGISVGVLAATIPSLAKAVGLAALRCTLQLYLVAGALLTHLFSSASTNPWMVPLWVLATGVLAALEASGRVEYSYADMPKHLTISILAGAALVMSSAIAFALFGSHQPWFSARTWIPVAGMLYGNSLTATTLSAGSLTRGLVEERQPIELYLAHGATWKEATSCLTRASLTNALTPSINALSIAGIVHIPGMMTGQMLAGQPPYQAAAYQLLIFFLIASMVSTTVHIFSRLALRRLIDQKYHRLDPTQSIVFRKKGSNKKSVLPKVLQKMSSTIFRLRTRRNGMFHVNGAPMAARLPVSKKPEARVKEFELQSEQRDRQSRGNPVLSLRRMRVKRGNFAISLNLYAGDRIAIQGQTGAGKSQILRTILGLEEVNLEDIVFNGRTVDELDTPFLRSRVLLVSQDRPTGNETPREFFDGIQKFKCRKNNQFKVMDPVAIAAPWGLAAETFDRPWSTLSGGEAQRALIAIALSQTPDILLLDESTSALDSKTELLVEKTLKSIDIPILMISHSTEQVSRFCNLSLNLDSQDATREGRHDTHEPRV